MTSGGGVAYVVGMRAGRVIRKLLILLLVTLLGAAVAIYAMVHRVPPAYRWRHLGPQQQKAAADRFVNHIAGDFGEKIGRTKPGETFTWTITADQANAYLAGIDAIVSLGSLGPDRPGRALAEMERAGLADPFVGMGDGVVTLMAKARRHDVILSVDLAFQFDDAGQLTLRVAALRVGVMPVPQWLLAGQVHAVRESLSAQLAQAESSGQAGGVVDTRRLAGMARQLLRMLAGEHVRPELVYKLGATHRALVQRIEITDGALTLHCVGVED